MKLAALVSLFLGSLGLVAMTGCSSGQREKQEREASYQAKLKRYSDALKPGTTRESVEGYLRAKNIHFFQLCCIEGPALADLLKIGQQRVPWYCDQHNVYIAFQFEAESKNAGAAQDSDKFTKVSVFHKLDGCL
jgi:hypothetical protein